MDRDLQLEQLAEMEYWVIDFLPKQVKSGSRSEILENVEDFFKTEKELEFLSEKFVNIILKTWCYFDFEIYTNRWVERPKCETLEILISNIVKKQRGSMSILLPDEETLLQIGAGNLHMKVYNPSPDAQDVLKKLAVSEGLFWWQPK